MLLVLVFFNRLNHDTFIVWKSRALCHVKSYPMSVSNIRVTIARIDRSWSFLSCVCVSVCTVYVCVASVLTLKMAAGLVTTECRESPWMTAAESRIACAEVSPRRSEVTYARHNQTAEVQMYMKPGFRCGAQWSRFPPQ